MVATLARICCVATKAFTEAYRNELYDFSADVPAVPTACFHQPPAPNDGFWPGLDRVQEACQDNIDDHRSILVYAAYIALFWTGNADFLRFKCGTKLGTLRPTPNVPSIAGRQTGVCRLNRTNGWIDVVVVTQDLEWSGLHTALYDRTALVNTTPSID